ncbi:hypothetical protein ANCCAN_22311 [Ancylostoma caninum]|uniref:Uncharacterized protein n=1 Tax=Ancylostoma caninum TaxID=29170 RepID=A0A368FIL5_ANCCA|nr:hypothetical protein ANCCAN_22311 [Ancylostoma caninum]
MLTRRASLNGQVVNDPASSPAAEVKGRNVKPIAAFTMVLRSSKKTAPKKAAPITPRKKAAGKKATIHNNEKAPEACAPLTKLRGSTDSDGRPIKNIKEGV